MAHIKIGDLGSVDQYIALASQTDFTITFPFMEDGDIKVYLDDSDIAETTGYSLIGAGQDSGGTLIFDVGLTVDTVVTIRRDMPVKRTTDFTSSGSWSAKNVNDELDKIIMMTQQIEDKVSRAPLNPLYINESYDMPVAEAGKAVKWNAAGDGLENSTDDFDGIVTAAEAAQTAAELAQAAAELAETNAETAETNAETSETNAAASETAAAASVNDIVTNYHEETATGGETYVDVGFTLASDLDNIACFVNGKKEPKSRLTRTTDTRLTFGSAIPGDAICGSLYSDDINLSWGGGNLIGTETGGAVVVGNQLNLAGNTVKYVDYEADLNADMQQVMAFMMRVRPDYNGSPVSDKNYFLVCKAHGDAKNYCAVRHRTTGQLNLMVFDSAAAEIINVDLGVWSAVEGQLTELYAHTDITAGDSRIFVDGVQSGATQADTGTRDADIGLLRIGSNSTGTNTSDFYVESFVVYDAIQHTANYTPDTFFPYELNAGDIIEVRSVSFSATATGDAAASAAAALSSATSANASSASALVSANAAETAQTAAELAETNAVGAVGAVAIKWDFDDSVVMGDPLSGNMRLNHATIGSATAIAVSKNTAEAGNPDISDYVATWDDSTNTSLRGTLVLRSGASFAIFSVTGAVTDNGDWLEIAVTYVTGSGVFTDGNDMFVQFIRTGNKGTDGAGAGDMLAANNLSDVVSASTSLGNIGGQPELSTTASKYGALLVQNNADDDFEILSGQGTAGQILKSNGADALPSFGDISEGLFTDSTLQAKTDNYTLVTADAGKTTVFNGASKTCTTPTVNATNHGKVFMVQNINASALTLTTVVGLASLAENESAVLLVDNTNSEVRALASAVSGGGSFSGAGFSAKRTAVQTGIVPFTYTKVQCNVENFDDGGVYDAATNYRFIPPNGETWIIFGAITFEGITDQKGLICLLYKNGTRIDSTSGNQQTSTGVSSVGSWTNTIVEGNGTDYYELYCYQGDTVNRDIKHHGTRFWGARVK